ncbi:twin-arginine translocase TatA/TatE family subunit [Halalkalibacterium ligniniphilum]|uniref:twin-arginine translocase TatA/TatE family subunit n=1 Tax=Halalkalibacterium ligniniphilum TaxID=1134413 RepID=UPI00034BA8A1|nr:twin-arginine translocase TatA/TatE family subunit [Halalkalibacterium ligniniphilum]
MVGPAGLVLIGTVALLVFGPKKLPEVGRAAGKTLLEFKNATKGIMDDENDTGKKDITVKKSDNETKL